MTRQDFLPVCQEGTPTPSREFQASFCDRCHQTQCTRPAARKLARRFLASYFNVGDLILYGKYKNKKGRIIEIGKDPKGNPTITIEPIPKGRKQNKLMGLFKIWKAPLDKQAKTGTTMEKIPAKRVVARYLQARGVEVGRTVVVGDVRIKRFADHFRITDLTNAGKRGKKVREMTLSPSYSYPGNKEEWLENMSAYLLDHPSYDRIKSFIKDIQRDFPKEINMDESEVRGIDVTPAQGSTVITLKTNTGLEIKADPLDWSVKKTVKFKGKGDSFFNQDTLYYPDRKRLDTQPFYNWLVANMPEANQMDIEGFKKLWDSLGVRWDSH